LKHEEEEAKKAQVLAKIADTSEKEERAKIAREKEEIIKMEEQETKQVRIKLDEGKKLTEEAEMKVQKKAKSYEEAIEK